MRFSKGKKESEEWKQSSRYRVLVNIMEDDDMHTEDCMYDLHGTPSGEVNISHVQI